MPVDLITLESKNVITKSIIIIALAIFCSLIVILYFSKNFADRINVLRNEMHKVVKGNFNIKKEY